MQACSQWGAWYQQGSGRAGTEAIGGRLGRASVRSVASCQSSRASVKDGGIPDVGQVSFAGSALALHTLVTSFAEGGSCSRSRCFGHRGGVGWWRSAARSAAVAAGPRAAGVSISGLVGVVMPLRRRGQREGETGGIGSVSMGGGFMSVTAGCELSA